MKNILVIGAAGQIGSELTLKLRERGTGVVVAGVTGRTTLIDAVAQSGPSAICNVLDPKSLGGVIDTYRIDTVYNLAALLSAVAEDKPLSAWDVGVNGLINVLELAREKGLSVFTPSSIGVFGAGTPLDNTPQDTVCRPKTVYGITKVTGELLSDYYWQRWGVDTRSVRYPGLISYVTPPGGGTTDYAVDIYYAAAQGRDYCCPLKAGTYLDMMFMPDALRAAVELMEADPQRLKHRNSFNVGAMSFEPQTIAAAIKRRCPDFSMTYSIDTLRQGIAESWPNSLDDSAAREEWGWRAEYDLERMTDVMLEKLKEKFAR